MALVLQGLFFSFPFMNNADKLGNIKTNFTINLFWEKNSFTGKTSIIEKDAKYRSETKNIQFFSYNVCFVFKKIGNSQNILRKILFHI